MLLLLLCSFGMVAQKEQSALLIDKQSRDHNLNLKDSVNSVRFFYTYFKEDLPEYEQSHLYLKNDVRTTFYYEFSKYGHVTGYLLFLKDSINQPIERKKLNRSKYTYDDLEMKQHVLLRNQVYPSYRDYVRLDKVQLAQTQYYQNQYNSFIYTIKDSKIIQEDEYIYFTAYGDTLNQNMPKELIQQKKYFYDTIGNLIRLEFYPGNKDEPGTLGIMDTETSYCEATRMDYSYDTQNRLTKVMLTSCGHVVESEEYAYHSKKGYITTVKRYIVNPTYSKYPVNNMVATYNEHGDITEMHFILEGDNNPTRTRIGLDAVHRYYEYEYDKHNNWIKCKLYLLGTKDQPTAIAERRIEYYNQQK